MHAYAHVTPLKTLLEHTQSIIPMTTISTILYYTAYVLITGFLIITLLATVISDTKQLRDWVREEGPQDPQKESQNPVKGDHI